MGNYISWHGVVSDIIPAQRKGTIYNTDYVINGGLADGLPIYERRFQLKQKCGFCKGHLPQIGDKVTLAYYMKGSNEHLHILKSKIISIDQ